MRYRTEQDSLGEIRVPQDAYYGAQTQRAVENFPISGLRFPVKFISSLALIKKCAASVNRDLGLLPEELAEAIIQAAQDIIDGRLQDQFVVDVFQTGSGTSTNMNMNEVTASRANEILTRKRGGKKPVHPNDHVNRGQSSNDTIPSALHIAALSIIRENLLSALEELFSSLSKKSEAFKHIVKIGRTHLQDATPITLGQEFSGYASQIRSNIQRIAGTEKSLSCLALGGTAVGTGLNAHPEFAVRTIDLISFESGYLFKKANNHFEEQAAQDAAVETSGILKTLAVSLIKIANDIRWLASGPRCGIGEINLSSLQPGSSIMPGKVNPVIPEAVIQVAAQVIGNDSVITLGGQGGAFELNTMLPVIIHNLMQSIELLASVSKLFASRCIDNISANRDQCTSLVEKSLALATYLVPYIGYDHATSIAQEAYDNGETIREVVRKRNILSDDEINKIFDGLRGEIV